MWTGRARREKFVDKGDCGAPATIRILGLVPKGQATPDHTISIMGSGTGFSGFGHRTRRQGGFGHRAGRLFLRDISMRARRPMSEPDDVRIHDIRIADTEAYLVEPAGGGRGSGVLFLHWFDTEAPDGNRTQFLEEASSLAREHGTVSVLPQGQFPWSSAIARRSTCSRPATTSRRDGSAWSATTSARCTASCWRPTTRGSPRP